jgi:murein DD-endopeptidase MepM/ murein hydrolase activator NlpD
MRLMLAAGVSALAAGCSDASRFSADPFADPFGGGAQKTAARTTRGVDRAPTGAIASAPASSPIQAKPLAPPSSSASAAPRPAPVAPQQASGSGGSYNHWSAEGGTPITVAEGDTPAILGNRYGVPTDALLKVNGFSTASQVQPGSRLVIPVYRATAAPSPKPAAEPRVAQESKPAPKPEPKHALAKPAKNEKAAEKDDSDDDAPAPAPKKAAGKHVELPPAKPAKLAQADDEEDAKPAAAVKAKPVAKPAAKPAKAAKLAKADDEEEDKPATPVAKAKPAKPHVAKADDAEEEAAPAPKPVKAAKVARAEPAQAPVAVEAPAPAPVVKTAKADPAPVESSKVDKTTTTASVGPVEEEKPSDAAHPEFRWPARGRIIQGFANGGNDGINIAVPEGTQVKAAEGGTVVYAGNELKGYGNLVLIRHPNGFVSAYAHNGDIAVKRGDHVTRGQAIAKSGQSGNVASPQLHFELRKGSTPVDPTNYLAGL